MDCGDDGSIKGIDVKAQLTASLIIYPFQCTVHRIGVLLFLLHRGSPRSEGIKFQDTSRAICELHSDLGRAKPYVTREDITRVYIYFGEIFRFIWYR